MGEEEYTEPTQKGARRGPKAKLKVNAVKWKLHFCLLQIRNPGLVPYVMNNFGHCFSVNFFFDSITIYCISLYISMPYLFCWQWVQNTQLKLHIKAVTFLSPVLCVIGVVLLDSFFFSLLISVWLFPSCQLVISCIYISIVSFKIYIT